MSRPVPKRISASVAELVIRFFAVGLDAASVTLQGAEAPGRGTMVSIRLVYANE